MTKKEIKYFEEILKRKAEEMTDAYEKTRSSSLENSEDGSMDIADISSNAYNRDFLLSLSDEERKVIVLIEEALRKIAEGSFGKCSACGKEISSPRLNAVPWAKHCIDCQELQEKGLL